MCILIGKINEFSYKSFRSFSCSVFLLEIILDPDQQMSCHNISIFITATGYSVCIGSHSTDVCLVCNSKNQLRISYRSDFFFAVGKSVEQGVSWIVNIIKCYVAYHTVNICIYIYITCEMMEIFYLKHI